MMDAVRVSFPPAFVTLYVLLTLSGFAAAEVADSVPVVHHDIRVLLNPSADSLSVRDRLDLAGAGAEPVLYLSCRAELRPGPDNGRIEARSDCRNGETVRAYRARAPKDGGPLTLNYELPVGPFGAGSGAQVLHLSGASGWYPRPKGTLATFRLEIEAPPGWVSVSQGTLEGPETTGQRTTVAWREGHPQEDIHLVAGRFHLYEEKSGDQDLQVYLLEPEPALAQRYLKASARYIRRYEDMLGRYPYSKFALVENDRPTGYGMPSFTLLGSRVIRLPFVIDTSYPHEILHVWWGNGVYVDLSEGNWSESLTTYLADHLQSEIRGLGVEYRRRTLGRYADYVSEGEDFPLTAFVSRHNDETQAVGYGKGMMVFHMLRRRLGDHAFLEGLRRFYRGHAYGFATYGDLRRAMEASSTEDLGAFFAQWLTRTGAPELSVRDFSTRESSTGKWVLEMTLEQVQPGPAYRLRVPVAVSLEGKEHAHEVIVEMEEKLRRVEMPVSARPLRVDVDPDFDLFRRPDPRELPPTLGQVFGDEELLIVLPAGVDRGTLREYEALASSWQDRFRGARTVMDQELESLPGDRSVWVLGRENRFAGEAGGLIRGYEEGTDLLNHPDPGSGLSTVRVARRPDSPQTAVGLLEVDDAAALAGLARKLPHYGAYSYLVFEGLGPRNVNKGQWKGIDSPLAVTLNPSDTPVSAARRTTRRALGDSGPGAGDARPGVPAS